MGPHRAELLKKELAIFTFEDLLNHFPYRHIDRTRIDSIASINEGSEFVQVKGRLGRTELIGQKSAKRLVAP